MKLITVANQKALSQRAAKAISDFIHEKPQAVLGLATGGTPEGTYKELVEDYNKNHTSYKQVTTVNLDEYVGLIQDDPNSYHHYMKEKLFNHVDLRADHCFLPDGNAASLKEACLKYDRLIEHLGGIDLQLLGIGQNGHIGFNEPGTPHDIGTHVVTLTPSTRAANARYFSSLSEVPEKAITMGIGTILKSKAILLIASGKAKAEAMKELLSSTKSDEKFPASALIQHPNVTIIADEAALSLVPGKVVRP
ncbi:glucosamine-6-phosphate deaminase [Sporolactobacillus sp. Y61]|uniref:Glucosamine-6-phosphate deaminase n=1 Tax=Sporolactobacillus sp. Y61 TaxID=3160863 RepID=A0AAU8ICD7_9BACL|nr:glucosamine-6-phosphate deaminase [Sporolactobacillus sp. THM19-2]RYL92212.1 glucosamine-6-phosphate deaminase [Sporolactobacillus sp. THM19-2]